MSKRFFTNTLLFLCLSLSENFLYPAIIYWSKIDNRDNRKRCERFSKSTQKSAEQSCWWWFLLVNVAFVATTFLNSVEYSETYLESSQVSMNSQVSAFSRQLFLHKVSIIDFHWVLNMPLILSSNVIWHTYGSIAHKKFSDFMYHFDVFYLLNIRTGFTR